MNETADVFVKALCPLYQRATEEGILFLKQEHEGRALLPGRQRQKNSTQPQAAPQAAHVEHKEEFLHTKGDRNGLPREVV